jgi:hypothetical protein
MGQNWKHEKGEACCAEDEKKLIGALNIIVQAELRPQRMTPSPLPRERGQFFATVTGNDSPVIASAIAGV